MNKKKQLAYYRDKTNEISKQLSASNQKYFEDLREYLFFSSLFQDEYAVVAHCLLYTSPSPRDRG